MLIIYLLIALDVLSFVTNLAIQTKHVLLLGGSFFAIGLLGSLSSLLSVVWRPIAGHLSDQKNKQDVIIWCLLLSLFGNILAWASPSMWLYSTAKVICVANTAVQTLLKTTVTDLCASDEESSKVFNKLGAFNSIAFLFGIVLGSHIADYERGIDYAYLLIISNIVVSIGLVKTLPRVDSKGTKHDDKDVGLIEGALKEVQSVYIDLKKLVVSPRYWDIFTIHLLIECGFFMYYNSSGLTLRTQHNMSEKYIGYLITLIMVVSVGCRLVMSKMKSKFYPTDLGYLMLWHSTLAEALAYLTLALTSSLAVFVLAMAAVSCAKTFIDTALNNLLLSRTEASEKGIVISSFDNVVSVGQVLGPLLAGTVSEIFGIRSSYIVGAVFMFVGSQIANTQRTR